MVHFNYKYAVRQKNISNQNKPNKYTYRLCQQCSWLDNVAIETVTFLSGVEHIAEQTTNLLVLNIAYRETSYRRIVILIPSELRICQKRRRTQRSSSDAETVHTPITRSSLTDSTDCEATALYC